MVLSYSTTEYYRNFSNTIVNGVTVLLSFTASKSTELYHYFRFTADQRNHVDGN